MADELSPEAQSLVDKYADKYSDVSPQAEALIQKYQASKIQPSVQKLSFTPQPMEPPGMMERVAGALPDFMFPPPPPPQPAAPPPAMTADTSSLALSGKPDSLMRDTTRALYNLPGNVINFMGNAVPAAASTAASVPAMPFTVPYNVTSQIMQGEDPMKAAGGAIPPIAAAQTVLGPQGFNPSSDQSLPLARPNMADAGNLGNLAGEAAGLYAGMHGMDTVARGMQGVQARPFNPFAESPRMEAPQPPPQQGPTPFVRGRPDLDAEWASRMADMEDFQKTWTEEQSASSSADAKARDRARKEEWIRKGEPIAGLHGETDWEWIRRYMQEHGENGGASPNESAPPPRQEAPPPPPGPEAPPPPPPPGPKAEAKPPPPGWKFDMPDFEEMARRAQASGQKAAPPPPPPPPRPEPPPAQEAPKPDFTETPPPGGGAKVEEPDLGFKAEAPRSHDDVFNGEISKGSGLASALLDATKAWEAQNPGAAPAARARMRYWLVDGWAIDRVAQDVRDGVATYQNALNKYTRDNPIWRDARAEQDAGRREPEAPPPPPQPGAGPGSTTPPPPPPSQKKSQGNYSAPPPGGAKVNQPPPAGGYQAGPTPPPPPSSPPPPSGPRILVTRTEMAEGAPGEFGRATDEGRDLLRQQGAAAIDQYVGGDPKKETEAVIKLRQAVDDVVNGKGTLAQMRQIARHPATKDLFKDLEKHFEISPPRASAATWAVRTPVRSDTLNQLFLVGRRGQALADWAADEQFKRAQDIHGKPNGVDLTDVQSKSLMAAAWDFIEDKATPDQRQMVQASPWAKATVAAWKQYAKEVQEESLLEDTYIPLGGLRENYIHKVAKQQPITPSELLKSIDESSLHSYNMSARMNKTFQHMRDPAGGHEIVKDPIFALQMYMREVSQIIYLGRATKKANEWINGQKWEGDPEAPHLSDAYTRMVCEYFWKHGVLRQPTPIETGLSQMVSAASEHEIAGPIIKGIADKLGSSGVTVDPYKPISKFADWWRSTITHMLPNPLNTAKIHLMSDAISRFKEDGLGATADSLGKALVEAANRLLGADRGDLTKWQKYGIIRPGWQSPNEGNWISKAPEAIREKLAIASMFDDAFKVQTFETEMKAQLAAGADWDTATKAAQAKTWRQQNFVTAADVPPMLINPVGRAWGTFSIGRIRSLNALYDWTNTLDGERWARNATVVGVLALLGELGYFEHMLPGGMFTGAGFKAQFEGINPAHWGIFRGPPKGK